MPITLIIIVGIIAAIVYRLSKVYSEYAGEFEANTDAPKFRQPKVRNHTVRRLANAKKYSKKVEFASPLGLESEKVGKVEEDKKPLRHDFDSFRSYFDEPKDNTVKVEKKVRRNKIGKLSHAEMRRAFILKEILDKPLASR